MKTLAPLALIICFGVSGCQANEPKNAQGLQLSTQHAQTGESKQSLRDEIYERARQRNGGHEPTQLELLNELMGKAQEEVSDKKPTRQPRIIARGARPAIEVRNDKIFVNERALSLGAPLEIWLKAIPSTPRCDASKGDATLCIWDTLGIAIGTSPTSPTITKFLNVSVNLEPADPLFPDRPRPFRPKQAFPGYLELDGYGIDAKTQFWEIRAKADPKRNLRCGSRDCSHPHGGFSDKANLYLRLNGATENSTLYEFTISADEDSPQPQQ